MIRTSRLVNEELPLESEKVMSLSREGHESLLTSFLKARSMPLSSFSSVSYLLSRVLDLRSTTSQNCEAAPRRARI